MSRRDGCRAVLETEMKRWSGKSCAQILSELACERRYAVEQEHEEYQIEVVLLENTDRYVHVMVSVDDSSFLASCHPLTDSFIQDKTGCNAQHQSPE